MEMTAAPARSRVGYQSVDKDGTTRCRLQIPLGHPAAKRRDNNGHVFEIRRIDPTVTEAEAEAEGIVASMRLQYSTLDPLPAATFHEEIELARQGYLAICAAGWGVVSGGLSAERKRELIAWCWCRLQAERCGTCAAPRRAGGVDVEVRAGRGGWDGFASGGAAHPARPGRGCSTGGRSSHAGADGPGRVRARAGGAGLRLLPDQAARFPAAAPVNGGPACTGRGSRIPMDTWGPRAVGAVLALVDERERATLPAGPSFGGFLRCDADRVRPAHEGAGPDRGDSPDVPVLRGRGLGIHRDTCRQFVRNSTGGAAWTA